MNSDSRPVADERPAVDDDSHRSTMTDAGRTIKHRPKPW
jgi:hypothetical protein